MISMDKKYRTRDGRDVRLLCVDGPEEDMPVVGFVSGSIDTSMWRVDGSRSSTQHPYDLIEYHEPDIRTIWVNVYEEMVIPYAYEASARGSKKDEGILAIAQPVTFEVKRDAGA